MRPPLSTSRDTTTPQEEVRTTATAITTPQAEAAPLDLDALHIQLMTADELQDPEALAVIAWQLFGAYGVSTARVNGLLARYWPTGHQMAT